MSLADFDVLERLGEGAFSQVFRVRRKSDGLYYALKKVKLIGLKDKEKGMALNEVRILASIQHPNVIAYKQAFLDLPANTLWYPVFSLVMEQAEGGDLLALISSHKRRGTTVAELQVWSLFTDMLSGLKALHDTQILHRDLKCANVFLTKSGSAKLGDMNVSKVAKAGMVYTQTGTPYYASPEVWKDLPYNSKSDIWSLGCVLYETVALRPPFMANDMQGLYKKVIRGLYPDIPAAYSADLRSLIRSMLQVNPLLRPSVGIFHLDQLFELPIVLRNRPIPISPAAPKGLLGTIVLPRNMSALSDRLPAAQYMSPDLRPPLSVKHEYEKPPRGRMSSRGREVMQQAPISREARALSEAREEQKPVSRNLSEARPSALVASPSVGALPPRPAVPFVYKSSNHIEPVIVQHSPVAPALPRPLNTPRRANIFQPPRPPSVGSGVHPVWWG